MKNEIKHNMGNAPNSEFIIGPSGKVLIKRLWSNPTKLREDLEKLVGKVENPTSIADLNLKTAPAPKVAKTGVVKRIKLPSRMRPLQFQPVKSENNQPYYVKFRAEADQALLEKGKGKLYLGFLLDPIYRVHWNNLTAPISVKLEAPEGVILSKTILNGPKVKVESDIDPREFLIDVDAGDSKGPIKMKVAYYACNDDKGWCKSLQQEYVLNLKVDPDGGFVARGMMNLKQGKITAIDMEKKTITIQSRNKKSKTYRYDKKSNFHVGRTIGSVSAFKKGQSVRFILRDDSKTIQDIGNNGPGKNRKRRKEKARRSGK